MTNTAGRTQFVFHDRNGCAHSVIEGRPNKTEDWAWKQLELDRAAERALAARGVTATQVPHDEYVAKYLNCMKGRCGHPRS